MKQIGGLILVLNGIEASEMIILLFKSSRSWTVRCFETFFQIREEK